MTACAWGFFLAFAGLAVGDWVAVAWRQRGAEYVFKPAALGALVLTAAALDPTDDGRRWWFVSALVLSLMGDVWLMLPTDRFVEGLGSFLLAHVAYSVGLNVDGGSVVALVMAAGGVAVVAVPLGRRVAGGARRRDPKLAAPVAAYIVVISGMVVSAIAAGPPAAIAGAVLFYASDALIAWSRFVGPFAGHRLWIIVTYHAGQAGLTLSLLS